MRDGNPGGRTLPHSLAVAVALYLATMALFVAMDTIAKYLLAVHSIVFIAWIRFFLHFMVLAAILPAPRRKRLRTRHLRLLAVRSMAWMSITFLFYAGLRHVPLAESIMLVSTAPFMIALLAGPVLGERIRPMTWAAIMLGFTGVVVVLRPGLGALHWGAVFPLLAAAAFSVAQIVTKRLSAEEDHWTILVYTAGIAALPADPLRHLGVAEYRPRGLAVAGPDGPARRGRGHRDPRRVAPRARFHARPLPVLADPVGDARRRPGVRRNSGRLRRCRRRDHRRRRAASLESGRTGIAAPLRLTLPATLRRLRCAGLPALHRELPVNREPLAPISEESVERFRTDGAVCLRGLVDSDWIALLRRGVARNLEAPTPLHTVQTLEEEPGFFLSDICSSQEIAEFREFVLNGPAAAAAARLMASERANFWADTLWVKEARTPKRTRWHQDQPFFWIDGTQVCVLWWPLDPVRRENGLELVKGSHRWGRWFAPELSRFGQDLYSNPIGRRFERMPDIDTRRDEYEILSFDVEPGDAIAFHGLHRARRSRERGSPHAPRHVHDLDGRRCALRRAPLGRSSPLPRP